MPKYIIYISLIASLFFSFNTVKAKPLVKVLNYNIGDFASQEYYLTPQERTARMIKLADFIKNESIEIAYIQEFWVKTNDLSDLQGRLNAVGYPMYADTVPYEQFKPDNSVMLILSKYPLDNSTKKVSFEIRGNRSGQSIVVRNTPIGWFRLSNIHTHINEPCGTFKNYLNFYYQFDKLNNLLGGDINLFLNDKPLGVNDARDGDECVGINWADVNIDCTTSVCNPRSIEWFILPQESDLYISQYYGIDNQDPRLQISDLHNAYIAYIGSTNPKFPPSPTPALSPTPAFSPTPRVSPTPAFSKYDTNRDGQVTILDVLRVLKYIFN